MKHYITLLTVVLVCSACSQPADTHVPDGAPAPEAESTSVGSEAVEPLNLSTELIEDVLADDNREVGERATALPDMFDAGEDPRTRVKGKVLTNEEAQTLQDSVDGVQLELQVPTN